MIDYAEIEKRWQEEWAKARIFEGDINNKDPYMITAAFPYANAPQHVGHLRTYGTADVLARYKRMRGFNVLYPMAFHATGTPVLAFAKRIKNNDKELIEELRAFHIPDTEIARMTDPLFIADYFVKELERGMHAAGYSIDWRRKFVSVDQSFSKFIEWQFGILNSKGYLVKGKHPVGWCPNEDNAVGMHDTKHDVEPEIENETAIMFKVEQENAALLCATYRPETIYGVTNIFVNEKAKYVICSINDSKERYYLSKESADMLKYQMKIEVLGTLDGISLLSKKCRNPINDAVLPIFPGYFVREDVGTGIVMSVPAHAPFDYVAIERLRESGYDIQGVRPIKVIDAGRSMADSKEEGTGRMHFEVPALAYLKALNLDITSSDEKIEAATKLEYKEESHWGKMTVKGLEGLGEPEAREKIKDVLKRKKASREIYALTNESPVFCRCGYKVVVKVVDNQWFLNYGDKVWKGSVKGAFKNIRVLPEKSRNAFDSAIDWINLRAVARAQGLGTPFPFEKGYIIESLSDSTIYMSFYTISNLIRGISPEKLKPEFFDYVFLEKGGPDSVIKATGIDFEIIDKCRESFAYWYKETSRHSGPDLIFNHLVMYVFNHVAIFEKRYWPKQIVVNGFVLHEGAKMSKSLGNIIPLVDGIKKYGADPMRLVEIAGTDLFSNSDFTDEDINGVKERFEFLLRCCMNLGKKGSGELRQIDYWMYSKLNRKIENVTKSMETLELRDVSTLLLYNTALELRRYFARGGSNDIVLKDYLSKVVLMLQPIAPHVSEELWHILGSGTLAAAEAWPAAEVSMINGKIEDGEELIDKTIGDARQVVELIRSKMKKEPMRVTLIVADEWKRELNNSLAKTRSISKSLSGMKNEGKVAKESASEYLNALAKKMNSVTAVDLTQEDEYNAFIEAKNYIENILKIEVFIEKESDSKAERASRAMPLKPSIDAI